MPSSINSKDGGYQHYQRSLGDLEQEMQTETKRRRQRDEGHIAKIEENFRAGAVKEKKNAESAIQSAKKSMQDELSRERQNLKVEAEQLRKQTYDRMGRYNGEEASTLKDQLKTSEAARAAEADRHQSQSNQRDEIYSRRMESNNRDHQLRLEKSAEKLKRNIAGPYEEHIERQKQASREEKAASKQKYNDLDYARSKEIDEQRQRTIAAVSDVEREYKHRMAKSENATNDKSEAFAREANKKTERTVRNQHDAYERDLEELRVQVKDTTVQARTDAHTRAERDAAYTQERDTNDRRDTQILVEAYEDTIEDLKYKQGKNDNYYQNRSHDIIRKKEEKYGKLMRDREVEHHRRSTELKDEMDRSEKNHNAVRKKDQALAEDRLSKTLKKAGESKQEAIQKQLDLNRQTLSTQKQTSNDQIATLERALLTKSTSTRISDISPAQQKAVEDSFIKEYEQKMNTQAESKKEAVDSIQSSYAGRLTDTVERAEEDKANLTRTHAQETTQNRAEFLSTVQDVNEQKKLAINDQQREHQKEIEKMQRTFATAMEKVQRRFDQELEKRLSEARANLVETRQENEFSNRLQLREFQVKQAEQARNFQLQMEEQKGRSEDEISRLKEQLLAERMDMAKNMEREIESQRKGFEQRITSMEAGQKERERYLAASYEKQLDSARRTTARQMNRKA